MTRSYLWAANLKAQPLLAKFWKVSWRHHRHITLCWTNIWLCDSQNIFLSWQSLELSLWKLVLPLAWATSGTQFPLQNGGRSTCAVAKQSEFTTIGGSNEISDVHGKVDRWMKIFKSINVVIIHFISQIWLSRQVPWLTAWHQLTAHASCVPKFYILSWRTGII